MATKVSIGNLEAEIRKELKNYSDDVKEKVEDALPKIAKEGVKTLKSTSPKGKSRKHYADGWAMQEESGRLGKTVTVYNKSKPGLAHLLENGHAKRGGGRVEGITHIAPVEQDMIERLEEEIEKAVTK